jgi:membrane associated rhomboid family serine protease
MAINNNFFSDYPGYTPPRRPGFDFKAFIKRRDSFALLLMANIIVWLVIMVFKVITSLYRFPEEMLLQGYILEFFSLPADTNQVINRFWTLITYMFLHIDLLHILFNMLWLYWFGQIFLQYFNQRMLLLNYLAGGLSGALLYIVAYNLFPFYSDALSTAKLLGASASVMGIVAATAFYVPNYTLNLLFLGKIKVLYLAIILFILDFFMITSNNAGGHLAHIGGMLWGVAFARLYANGFKFSWFNDLGRPKPKFKKVYKNKRAVDDDLYNLNKKQEQEQIDIILDKIKRSGYASLTSAERDILFRASKK